MTYIFIFAIADRNYEETQDEAQRVCLPSASVSPQEDPQQQLPDATQLWSDMHHVAVPASDHLSGTDHRQGRDSASGRLLNDGKLQKQLRHVYVLMFRHVT